MARRPSFVCLSVVCKLFVANRFFSQVNGWIVTKLAHDNFQNSLHAGCAQAQGSGERSRDTIIIIISSTFRFSQKSLTQSGRLKMREWKNRHGRKCRGGKGGSGNIGKDRYCRMLCWGLQRKEWLG